MSSRYLAAKVAFLVLALFTVSYQCAAQCVLEQCHELGAKIPPCHRHNSTNRDTPPDPCKASLLVAAEVRIQSSDHAEPPKGMLLSFVVPELADERTVLHLRTLSWRPQQPLFPADITFTPLRI